MTGYEGYVVVCLGGLGIDKNNQPGFMVKVYGPYETPWEADEKLKDIKRLEGGAVTVRPLVSYEETVRAISAD